MLHPIFRSVSRISSNSKFLTEEVDRHFSFEMIFGKLLQGLFIRFALGFDICNDEEDTTKGLNSYWKMASISS